MAAAGAGKGVGWQAAADAAKGAEEVGGAEEAAEADVPAAPAAAAAVVGSADPDGSPVTVPGAGPVDAGPAPVAAAGCRSQPRIYGPVALRQRNQPR